MTWCRVSIRREMMTGITRLGTKDREEIDRIENICFPEYDSKEETWMDLLEEERTFAFAIKEKTFIKAYISIYNWKGEHDYIKIMSICTHPDHRNKGYGKKLMQYVIDEMLKDDMHVFKGETRASNTNMQKMFTDFGYGLVESVEGYYDQPDETAYKYVLEI